MLLQFRTKNWNWMTKPTAFVQQVCTVPSQPFDLKQSSTASPLSGCLPVLVVSRCVVTGVCVCVLFFCVWEWCCVYSVVRERVTVCVLYAWWIHASTRMQSCVCVVYVSMFFKCCVIVCSCITCIGMCVLFCFQCFRVSLQFAIPMVWCDTLEKRNDD